jgi:hypothetical protein
MKQPSDEQVMAYVDGELDESSHKAFERLIEQEPELAARVERQHALRTRLLDAFQPTLDEPLPQRLVDAAHSRRRPRRGATDTVRQPLRETIRGPAWFAIAASLVVGVLLGQRVFVDDNLAGKMIVSDRAGLRAAGLLAQALSTRLAAEPDDASAVRIGLTYRNNAGEYCRTFVTFSDVDVAGLACHDENDEWRIRVLETQRATPGTAGAMRQAATVLPESIRRKVESELAGEPLDQAGEVEARARDWQKKAR